jgi:vacuolar-type H+-ATPase subunit H
MFTRRRWVFLRMAVLCAGIGLMVAGGISYRLPRIYESTAVLEIPQSPVHNILMEGLIENLLSRNVFARSIERLGWSTTGGLEHEEALARLHSMLTVDWNGNRVTLRVRHPDPKQSCDIAWAVIRSYGESRTEVERRDTERRLAELKTAMEKQEKVIAEAREKLAEVIRNTKPEMLQSAPEQAEEPKPPMTAQQLTAAGQAQAERTRLQAQANRVTLRVAPEIPKLPVSPQVPIILTIGVLAGLAVSPLLAWGVVRHQRPVAVVCDRH